MLLLLRVSFCWCDCTMRTHDVILRECEGGFTVYMSWYNSTDEERIDFTLQTSIYNLATTRNNLQEYKSDLTHYVQTHPQIGRVTSLIFLGVLTLHTALNRLPDPLSRQCSSRESRRWFAQQPSLEQYQMVMTDIRINCHLPSDSR